jgi:hypothetical protein
MVNEYDYVIVLSKSFAQIICLIMIMEMPTIDARNIII